MADSKNNKQNAIDFVLRWGGIAFAVLMLALAVAVIDELFDGKSEVFRNWMLGITPIGAAIFWYLRNQVLKQQADAGDRQVETDQIRLTDERFSDAVKLLSQNDKNGKPTIAARLSGIFVLQKLAKDFDSEYLAQVVKTLFAYIKENIQLTAKLPLAESDIPETARSLGEDVKAAFGVLDTLLDTHKWKNMEHFRLSIHDFDFHGHDFSWLNLSFVRGIIFCNYESLGVDMRGASLSFLDLRSANLSYAKLQKSALRRANLQGAKLEHAQFQGADLSDAKLLYADFSDAELDEKTILSSEWSGKIWHSNQEEFKKRNIESLSWEAEWDLKPFLNSADSFINLMLHYGGLHMFFSRKKNQRMRAKKLRQAARKLQKDGKIPEGLPQGWLIWLSKIKEDGSHPNDTLSD